MILGINIWSEWPKRSEILGIVTMSPGLHRHKSNRTNWNSRRNHLFWTLELVWCLDSPLKVIEHGFPETCRLEDLFQIFISCDNENQQVKGVLHTEDNTDFNFKSHVSLPDVERIKSHYESMSELKEEGTVDTMASRIHWLLKIPMLSAKQPTYRQLDPSKPLYTQFEHQTILEFPTIEIHSQIPEKSFDGYPITILPLISEDAAFKLIEPEEGCI